MRNGAVSPWRLSCSCVDLCALRVVCSRVRVVVIVVVVLMLLLLLSYVVSCVVSFFSCFQPVIGDELSDLNRGRIMLRDIASRHSKYCLIVETVESACQHIIDAITSGQVQHTRNTQQMKTHRANKHSETRHTGGKTTAIEGCMMFQCS